MFKKLTFRSCKTFFGSWISMSRSFEKTVVKLESSTDIDMLLIVEKGIREEICHAIYQYAKANNKYMEDYDKNKESLYLKYYPNIFIWLGNVVKASSK